MNRRGFLKRLTVSAAGVALAYNLPTILFSERTKRYAATAFLAEAYNRDMRGLGVEHQPRALYASARVFDAFEGEHQKLRRFTASADVPGSRSVFKAALLYRVNHTSGWYVDIHAADGTVTRYT